METVEFANDDGAGRYGQNTVYLMQDQFITSHSFIYKKLKDGKLYCDHCNAQFPANLSFYIIVDESMEMLYCHPCNFIRTGTDPYEEIKKERVIADEARRLRMIELKKEQDEKNRIADEKRQEKELKIQEREKKMKEKEKRDNDKNSQIELF